MSFSFPPLSDEQINEIQNRGLLADGIYPFTVKGVEQQSSKAGNPMLKVRIGVLAEGGDERNIFDYLVAAPEMVFKIKHFCETIGLEDKYLKGNFQPNDCINRSGKVKIGIQKGAAKPDGSGFYPDKNSVKDYIKPGEEIAEKAKIDPDLNDDIKF